ncbi:hypothetical protein CTRI78_v004137 [Colletotrichum trifolii]|uniref:Clr5 domain-containing protein n=1 Tax=Colletotrichum trifolii TaxID=5466 RepID=A0A4R8RHM6_COLTR|nr:hypothetical protein CTRI78_v004137 [Colletotrichum trifolii]
MDLAANLAMGFNPNLLPDLDLSLDMEFDANLTSDCNNNITIDFEASLIVGKHVDTTVVEYLHCSRAGNLKTYVAPDDWEHYRSIITRLYTEEKKPLRQVREVMERQFAFIATMSKTRIKRWGLDKKFKEPEVSAIVRAMQQRDAAGKESQFIIRNQVVEWEDVSHYLKRRRQAPKRRENKTILQLGITCRTPPPREIRSPMAAIPDLQHFEDVLRLKRDYLAGVFEGKVWVFDNDGNVLSSEEGLESRWACMRLDFNLSLVRELLRRGFVKVAFSRLNQQMSFIKSMIQCQEPIFFYILCQNLLQFYQQQLHPGMLESLISFVADMYRIILGSAHPFGIIWKRIANLSRHLRIKLVGTLMDLTARYLTEEHGYWDEFTRKVYFTHLVTFDPNLEKDTQV